MRRTVKTVHLLPPVAAGVVVALFAAGCGGTSAKAPSSPSPSRSQPAPSRTSPSSPPQAREAPVGETFTIKAEDGTTYDVTLLKFVEQASPGSEFDTPSPSKHLAAAEFRISAATMVDENANNNATAIGDNQQTYTSSLLSVAEGTNFNAGQVKLQPGDSSIGWVSFEIPAGVTVAKVVWTASSGFSSATCEWLVSSPSSPSPSPSSGQARGPAATVRAYFAAISAHNWPLAWSLGGENTGTSYADFVRGHNTTAKVTVTIQAVTGDVVTATIVGEDNAGTVKTFQGEFTVQSGVIVHFNVHEGG